MQGPSQTPQMAGCLRLNDPRKVEAECCTAKPREAHEADKPSCAENTRTDRDCLGTHK